MNNKPFVKPTRNRRKLPVSEGTRGRWWKNPQFLTPSISEEESNLQE